MKTKDPLVLMVEMAKKELKKDKKKYKKIIFQFLLLTEIESLLSKDQFPDDPDWVKKDEVERLKVLLSANKNITVWYKALFKD